MSAHRRSSFLDLLDRSPDRYKKEPKLSGIIYIHRISDNRFGGVAGRNFKMFRKLCGEPTLRNVVLVTNMWKEGSREINESREKELSSKFFRPALDKHAQMARHYNTLQSAHGIVQKIMANHPAALQIQWELVDRGKKIINTEAGRAITQELDDQIRRHEAELKEVREEMKQAVKEKDEETKLELEGEVKRLRKRMDEIMTDKGEMAKKYAAEKQRLKDVLGGTKQGAQRIEQDEANHTHRYQDENNELVADRPRPEQQVKGPRDLQGAPATVLDDELAHRDTHTLSGEIGLPTNRGKSLPPTPVRIACVPNNPLSCRNAFLIVVTGLWAQLGAEKHP